MKNTTITVLFIAVLLFSFDLFALPRFAVKLGDKCSDCHYNPSGGQNKK